MSHSTIELEWARTQIEAMADGALSGADLERMRRALSRDASLREALADAGAVVRRLRRTRLPAPPSGLLRRLLAAGPGADGRGHGRWMLGVGFGTPILGVLSTAAITLLFAVVSVRTPDPEREAALRDFAIAMNYLRQTAVVTQEQVGRQVGQGLFVAMEVSTQSLAGDKDAGGSNGG